MKNIVLVSAACLVFLAGHAAGNDDPLPLVTEESWTIQHVQARTVRLNFPHVYNGLVYTVFRDGDEIGTFTARTSGSDSGCRWGVSGSVNYFDDLLAMPGAEHIYTVHFLADSGEKFLTTEFLVPLPVIPDTAWSVAFRSGRTVVISIPGNSNYRFDSLFYEVYRDGEKLGEFRFGEKGSNEAGHSWALSYGAQSFTDVLAYPGALHTYELKFCFFDGLTLSQEKKVEIPVPNITETAWSMRYHSDRRVNIVIPNNSNYHINSLFYEVYRDGEKLGEFRFGETGSNEAGHSWTVSYGTQSFTDVLAYPGQVHTYELRFCFFDGYAISQEKELQIPAPEVTDSAWSIRYAKDRNVVITIPNNSYGFDSLLYEVYRDGEKLGEFRFGEKGSNEAGHSWALSYSSQTFTDVLAYPGSLHTYELRFCFFDGYAISQEKELQIPAPEVTESAWSVRYASDRNVVITIPNNSSYRFDTLFYEVYRDGEKLGEFRFGETGSNEAGHSWAVLYGTQTFTDVLAYPGELYTYELRFCFFDGYAISQEKELQIPAPEVTDSAWSIRYLRARSVVITIPNNSSYGFDNLVYEVYRDGEKLGQFRYGETGSNDAGHSWNISNNYSNQSFTDAGAMPGAVHKYELKFNFFEGYTVTLEENFAVPAHEITDQTWTVSHVRARQVQITIPRNNFGFPDLVYELYRDGVKFAEFQNGATGENDYGILGWSTYNFTQFFTDPKAFPGRTHTYTLVFRFDSEYSVTSERVFDVPLPDVASWWTAAASQYEARLTLGRDNGGFEDLVYTIRRDGKELASFRNGDAGSSDACSWGYDNYNFRQFFRDRGAVPGVEHVYEVEFYFWDDLCVTDSKPTFFPLRLAFALTAGNGQRIQLDSFTDRFPGTMIQIYRDGQFLAEFGDGSAGQAVNGDNWYLAGSRMYFIDTHPVLGSVTYKAVYIFPNGETGTEEEDAEGPAPKGFLWSTAYFPILARLDTGEYLLMASYRITPNMPTTTCTLEVSGSGAVFAENGLTTLKVDGSQLSELGFGNVCILASPDINPETAAVDLKIGVEFNEKE